MSDIKLPTIEDVTTAIPNSDYAKIIYEEGYSEFNYVITEKQAAMILEALRCAHDISEYVNDDPNHEDTKFFAQAISIFTGEKK